MDCKNKLSNCIVSVLLVVALMMPAAIQFYHLFEGHDHVACNEQTTHVHQDTPDCEICHFHLASFSYDLAQYPDLLVLSIPVKAKINFASLQFHSFQITNTQLRGPPNYS